MPADYMNFEKFLKQWNYSVSSPFKSFDGTHAEWAPKQPATWGNEVKKILPRRPATHETTAHNLALSPDETLLAFGLGKDILIYNTITLELVESLKCHPGDSRGIAFQPNSDSMTDRDTVILAAECSERNGDNELIILWELTREGKDKFPPPSLPSPAEMAVRATASIVEPYNAANMIVTPEIKASIITGFEKTLESVTQSQNLEYRTTIPGKFASFGSPHFGENGMSIYYIINPRTTQQGSRPAGKLPTVAIFDVASKKTTLELKGHTDSIMWIGESPNGKFVASASWDGTVRVWNTTTGASTHEFGPYGGQMWSGVWSPDSKQLAFSVGNPKTIVFVYDVNTGMELQKWEGDDESGIKSWARSLAWSRDGKKLAAGGRSGQLCVWDPNSGKEIQRWTLKLEQRLVGSFVSVTDVKFFTVTRKHGDKEVLFFKTGDGAIEGYDFEENQKFHFARGEEEILSGAWGNELCFLKRLKLLVSADGDGSIRFWNLDLDVGEEVEG